MECRNHIRVKHIKNNKINLINLKNLNYNKNSLITYYKYLFINKLFIINYVLNIYIYYINNNYLLLQL